MWSRRFAAPPSKPGAHSARRENRMPANSHRPDRRFALLSVIMLLLSAVACATFREPGDPAPTRPPDIVTSPITPTLTTTPTDPPAPPTTPTPTPLRPGTAPAT